MKMLFLAPSRMSKGDAGIAADLARQIPRKKLQAGFVSSAESVPQLHDLGMPTLPLSGVTPEENLAILDRVVKGFRPDVLIAADAFAVDRSREWSGLSFSGLRERYDCPIGSIDRVGWQTTGYTADFYGGAKVKLPSLLDECDVLIRPCPPHAPVAGEAGVVYTGLHQGGLQYGGLRPVSIDDAPADKKPVVFLANSEWEYRNPRKSLAVAQLIDLLPRLIHDHLAALGRPVQVVHVSPHKWSFPIAETIDYKHFTKLPYPMFHARLAAADLFLTTNVLSATLGRAVLAGVPALALQNRVTGSHEGKEIHPFRVAPLGWHDLLEPLLAENPFRDCFSTAELLDRDSVQRQLSTLLDDSPERAHQRQSQAAFHEQVAALPQPLDALKAAVTR